MTTTVVPTSSLDERIDFAELIEAGFTSGQAVFADCEEDGVLSGSNLHMRANLLTCRSTSPQGTTLIGEDPDGELASNSEDKANTCATYRMNSDAAYATHGDAIPDGPQRWTGGFYHKARVEIYGRWFELEIVTACSGVQGHYDLLVAVAIAVRIGAEWALEMKSLAGIS